MAFFGLFGGDKPTPQNIQKLVVKVRERYAQPEYRREAMDRLLSFDTEEALLAVAQRFCVVVQSPHWDEEEKRWLVDELASRGALATQALRKFLARENEIRFAARALERLTTREEYVAHLGEALALRPPEDHRSTPAKVELIQGLGETAHNQVIDLIAPYLDDHSDDVQCATLDVIERLLQQAPRPATDPVTLRISRIVHDDTRSARVLRTAARVMANLRLPIDVSQGLPPAVLEDFVVQDGRIVAATRAAQ